MNSLLTLFARRSGMLLLGVALTVITFNLAGPRSAFLVCVGLGYGVVLEGLRFGFAGPWRMAIVERDGRGLLAQFLAIGLTAAVAFPLLAANPTELSGAHAPVGVAMIAGAFVFGMAMQLVMGCGSGTLVNAGSGNLVGILALLGFVAGSFAGSIHVASLTAFGSLPVISLQGLFGANAGLLVTLLGLAILALITLRLSRPGCRRPPVRLVVAAALLAGLALLNLTIAGQPWGVVYGLGLWGAKIVQWGGVDVAATGFWSVAGNLERLEQSILTDVTSLTNIGLIVGAFIVMEWRREHGDQVANLQPIGWLTVVVAGIVLGYSARIAFGCNVGAFFSGVSTGSLHGWVWFFAAFGGSALGIRLRPYLLSRAAPDAGVSPA